MPKAARGGSAADPEVIPITAERTQGPRAKSQRAVRDAYEHLRDCAWAVSDPGGPELEGLRPLVRDSWQRSLVHNPDPDKVTAITWLHADALQDHRDRHPLAAVMPVIQRLLIDPSQDTGIVVAVADEHGRLLWVDGDRPTLRRTERMQLLAGVDWSEQRMGTSAPGTALVIGGEVQIRGAEHFNPVVQRWNCTAVPVRDPRGLIVGVIDVTGGPDAGGLRTLAWVRAAVAAAEAELRLAWQNDAAARQAEHVMGSPVGPVGVRSATSGHPLHAGATTTLAVLGRGGGLLIRNGQPLEISVRHSEILTLLAFNTAGLTSNTLTDLVNPDLTVTTLRAEILRLRRVLADFAPELIPSSRPYLLPTPLELDAVRVLELVSRGHLEEALRIYPGAVLPDSDAPGVVRLRARVSRNLREAVLADGSLSIVLEYLRRPEAEHDPEAWHCALRLLPPRSPRRAVVVAQLEHLQSELG